MGSKLYANILITTVALLTLVSPQFFATEVNEITIVDKTLEGCMVNSARVSNSSELTEENLSTIRNFTCEGNVKNLSGIEYLTGAKSITLNDGGFTVLTPLSGLTNLTELHINGNVSLSTIDPITSLVNLEKLSITLSRVKNITALETMTKLTDVVLVSNGIVDVAPLANAVNLENLQLSSNAIADPSPLNNLTKLTNLDISGNEITDISSLSALVNLTSLNVWTNELKNIEVVSNFEKLITFQAGNDGLSDLSPLSDLPELVEVNISNSDVSDLTTLTPIETLESVTVVNCKVSDISPLIPLEQVTELYLASNQLSDISPLLEMETIVQLSITDNNIESLEDLKNLSNLTNLSFGNNNVDDLTTLSKLSKLKVISGYGNEVSDLSPLKDLANLTSVKMQNQVAKLEDVTIYTNDDYKFEYTGLDNTKYYVNLGKPKLGVNEFSGSWDLPSTKKVAVTFNGTFTQNVTYDFNVTNLNMAVINEESQLDNNLLATLLEIVIDEQLSLEIDSSVINVSVPNVYVVKFIVSDSEFNTKEYISNVEVKDILPQISTTTDTIIVENGDTIDYATAFGVSGTEISDGDITNTLTVSNPADTLVADTYSVNLTVTDNEANPVTKTVTVIVNAADEVESATEDSEVATEESEAATEENEPVSEPTSNEVSEVKAEKVEATGSISFSILVTTLISLVFVVLLKRTINNN